MWKKVYWDLLVLLSIFCKGIIGTHSEKDTDELSDLLIREKRVINLLPGKDLREPIRNFPYVVVVKRMRFNSSCVGVILTHHIVLTVAECVTHPIEKYRVYSGCAQSRSFHIENHKVTNIRSSIGNHPSRPIDGIALITVTPLFVYCASIKTIGFYEGHVHPGLHVTVAGWGCNHTGHPGTEHPDWLRSITVPVISNEDCNILYLEHYTVSDRDICTLDAFGHQYCGDKDAGAPLVIEVNHRPYLAGIHLWSGRIPGRSNPDVFVNLQHPSYKSWIWESIHILEGHIRT